jgi:EpsI family protein
MGNILIRIGVVAGVLVATQLGYVYVFGLTNPQVVPPSKALDSFPLKLRTESTGEWVGKDEKLDDQEFNYAQLDNYVSRVYANRDNRTISLLLGQYNRPSSGLYHNPFNCYHTHGFALKEDGFRPLTASNRPDTKLSMSTWEKEGRRFVVVYWYELGDHTMFERDDLAPWKSTLWAMRGKPKWPAMFKVLIQAPATGDLDQAKADVLDMAKVVREWLGTAQPVME